MIPLLHDNICTIFLHSWLKRNGYTLDQLEPNLKKIRWSYYIKNSLITDKLESDYSCFKKSGQTLDDFFGRQIIICRGYNKKLFKIKVDRIDRIPIFIYQTTNNNTYLFGPNMSNLTSTNAIPSDLKTIMTMYGISKWPKDLSDFEPECGRTVALYKVLNGKAYYDIESVSELADIPIGFYKKQYFFIPNAKLIQGRYFCQKYPDQCLFNTTKISDRGRHEKTCSNDSIITAKQVLKASDVRFLFIS